ncbi:hypothetical protein BBJ28_00014642 [Nothophytophthora sp. Chile5]|nr:hypothetical protein BBJ28_00014642 [Nothophytophthora sp. Chile5]
MNETKPSASADRRVSKLVRDETGSFMFLHGYQELRNAFDPHSRLLKSWHQVLFGCLLYEAFLLPFAATFAVAAALPPSATAFRAFYAAETLFLVDFYVKFNTGFYEDGNIHRDKRRARVNYLKSLGFFLDVLAILPMSLLLPAPATSLCGASTTAAAAADCWPAWREFHKILRIWRVPGYFSNLDDVYAKHFKALKSFKVLVATVFVAHSVACGRFAFGWNDPVAEAPDVWLPPPPLASEPLGTQYAGALFWSVGLLTGAFDGALPRHNAEFAFTLGVTLSGLTLFMYACATLFMLSKSESNQTVLAQARINQLRHLLSFHHVPEPLQVQAVEYFERHYTDAESNDREVVKLLCPSITKDIQVELLKGMVGRIPLFRGCNEQFIVALTSLLEMTSFPAHVSLFEVGDPGDYMYVVNSGVLHILVNGIKVRELRQGSFFGEISVFSKRLRSAAVVTTSYCTLYRLSRFHTERVLEGYPLYASLIASAIEEMATEQEAATKAAKAAGGSKGTGDEFMLTTLYQMSTQSPAKKRRDSLRSRAKKVTRGALRRSKSIKMESSSRHAEYDGGNISINENRAAGFSKAPIVLPPNLGSKKIDNRKLVRSQSAFARRISTGKSFWNLHKADGTRSPASERADTMQGYYDKLSRRRSSQHQALGVVARVLSRLLMRRVIDRSSPWRKRWLIALQLHLALNWVLVPLMLAFPVLDRPTTSDGVQALYTILDILLVIDMYLNLHLSYTAGRVNVAQTSRTALRYLRGAFVVDLLCMLPYRLFLMPSSSSVLTLHSALLRLPRLLRVWRVRGHMREWDSSFRLSNNCRLVMGAIAYLLLLHLAACLYFSLTYLEGFSSSGDRAWLPSVELELGRRVNASNGAVDVVDCVANVSRTDAEAYAMVSVQYTRALYFAATMLTTLGKAVEPSSGLQYSIALLLMFGGFFSMAVLIDSVQKRLTASAFEQKEFLVTRTRVQQFLRSRTAPAGVHQRVHAFLDFWWSAHRGAIASELLNELPETIKRPVVQSMCQPALQTLSLLTGVRPSLDALEQVFVDNIRFILYGQGEIIYRQGDYASGLFFLLSGELIIITNAGMPRTLAKGGFIGTAALNLNEASVSYAERVTAASGCILIFVSREHLNGMHKTFPTLSMALRALEKRLEGAKLARAQQDYGGGERLASGALRPAPPPEKMTLEMKLLRYLDAEDIVFDPEANSSAVWELWIFLLITAQYLKVILNVTFGVHGDAVVGSEVVTVLFETCFAADFYFRSRLGYFEYGNKIMEVGLIRKRFFRSRQCFLDALALVPLFAINWMVPSTHRHELLSLNKLLRLLHVPGTFATLENKHLSHTLQLRLLKLVFISLVLSHLFGCIWFNFAPPSSSFADADVWMPPTSLETADTRLQYSALLFWSFGLMSSSNTGELPKTAAQCFFTSIVLVAGAFLFAFVVGNLSDVVDLIDADSREFNGKISSLRHLLAHFQLPPAIEDQLKTYFFFQRYHTITQEYLLERCLPPSLLTEIRLVHLQPMIAKVGFLAGMEGSVTRMLVSQFVQVLTVKDQYVFRYGEEGSDMFFVFTGILEVFVPQETLQRRHSNDTKLHALGSPSRSSFRTYFPILDPAKLQSKTQMRKVNELTSGSYFGEVALFTSKARSAHARSKTSCVLYKLSRQSLELVFERYPDWKRKVFKIVNIQQEQQLLRNLYMEEQMDVTGNNSKLMRSHVDVLGNTTNFSEGKAARSASSFSERVASGSVRVMRYVKTRPFAGVPTVGTAGSFFSSYKAQRSASTDDTLASIQMGKRKGSVLWVDTLLQCTEAQSAFHLQWLKVITVGTIYMALAVPYRNSFDALERLSALPIVERVLELVCEVLFGWDIWVNWNMKDGLASMELYEHHQRDAYKKKRVWIDVLSAIPIDHFLSDFYESPVLSLNRCLKLLNFPHYMREINRRSVSYEKNRLWTLWLLFFVLVHWCACAYFAIATATINVDEAERDRDWDGWAPPRSVHLIWQSDPSMELLVRRFLRGIFFASTAFVKKGKAFTPEDQLDYLFTLVVDFMGLLMTAFMIGEIASMYISYISNEVEFRKNHIAVDMYMERWHITGKLRARSHAFLSSLWSSHRGVNYQEIFDEIPQVIRTESILHIANHPLRAFVNSIFRPFATLHPHDRELEALSHAIAEHLKYESYPRDECVVVEGSVSKEMYFVTKGHLISITKTNPLLNSPPPLDEHYNKGDFFGEHGLLGYSVGVSTVRTVRACDLLSLSSEDLLQVVLSRPLFQTALSIAVEAYRDLCQRTQSGAASPAKGDETTASDDVWGVVLFDILAAHKKQWLDEALAVAAGGGEESTLSDFKTRQEVGLMMIATPSACLKVFKKLLHLIATRGMLDGSSKNFRQSAPQFQETLPLMNAALSPSPLISSFMSVTEKSDYSSKKLPSRE